MPPAPSAAEPAAEPAADAEAKREAHRLPGTVAPRRYEVELRPDLDAGSFTGTVAIDVDVVEPTDRIVLHALDLEIDAAEVESTSGHTAHIDASVSVTADPEAEQLLLVLPGELPAGTATIRLAFRGALNDQLVGFYRSTFTLEDRDGSNRVEHTLAVTQFESTHARRAFPCFDEPAMKAVFAISLVVDPDLFVVSNTAEVARETVDGGLVRVRFADTIPMSTYLVAFVIGPLEATGPRVVDGLAGPIELRVVHPPGSGHLCDFALDVAEAGLRFFEGYYEIPYPGDKVDLVAVPDFAFGAMENLGCITFREVLLLIDPDSATQPELQRVADVINHELAHMWFGDLVTMSWWNGIWLNEAFATFMEVLASDSFRPDWDVWTTFGLARSAAFDTDALGSTRPIEYEVVTAADAEGMFDILTYEKGASVVRMLEQYLGAERFRSGIVSYLRQHSYGSTETTDLWDALEAATGEPVRRIMDHWIFRGGHPLVRVEPTAAGIRLSQERFRYPSPVRPDSTPDTDGASGAGVSATGVSVPDGTPWPVPVVLSTRDSSGGDRRVLLEEPEEIDLGGPPALVQANLAGNGFYRVDLAPELRHAATADPRATPLERFVLIDDTWASFVAGHLGVAEVVTVLRACAATESDTAVWKRLAAAARRLVHMAGEEHRDSARALVVELARPAFERVEGELTGGEIEDRERCRELRGVLFTLLGSSGADEAIRTDALEIFRAIGQEGGERVRDVDASLRAAATDVVGANAGAAEHAELERRWKSAPTPQDELRYLHALVDTPEPELFDAALELAATEVRTQNAPYLLRRALGHPTLDARAWEFVSSRWDALVERFPANSLPRMLEGIRTIPDESTARSIEAFLTAHPLSTGGRQVRQHVERMWVSVAATDRARHGFAHG